MLPACVTVCPTGARKFGNLDDPDSEVARLLRAPHVISVLKPDMGNEPELHYLGLRREVV
jgi:Fe-S-cluster-containing dehydrogenase component